MIPQLVAEWEAGAFSVLCIKRTSEERSLMFWLRKKYYQLAERLSSIETIQNFTGFGLYDRRVIDIARSFRDPYPYFRGMIAEIGLPYTKIPYDQPSRKFGITKNNWYTLYDMGMLGIINHSRVPLRLAVLSGFAGAAGSFAVAVIYLVLQAAVLELLHRRPRAHAHRHLLHRQHPARLPGHPGRVRRCHLHPGPAAPLHGRARTHQPPHRPRRPTHASPPTLTRCHSEAKLRNLLLALVVVIPKRSVGTCFSLLSLSSFRAAGGSASQPLRDAPCPMHRALAFCDAWDPALPAKITP